MPFILPNYFFNILCLLIVSLWSPLTLCLTQSQLYCEQVDLTKKIDPNQNNKSELSWTEGSLYTNPQYVYEDQLTNMNKILAYQNERSLHCKQLIKINKNNIFSQKRINESNEIKITIAIGYNDNPINDYVLDDYLKFLIQTQLTSICPNNLYSNCGFSIKKNNAFESIFEKKIWNNEKTLVVQIIKSALTTDDKLNRDNPEQNIQSQATESLFYNSFTNSHFIFYLGHSRNGGGPDFFPAKLTNAHHPDYEWYHKNKIKKIALSNQLNRIKSDNKPLLFAMISCSSYLHFQKTLISTLPDTLLFFSKQSIYNFEYFQSIMVFINALEFKKSILNMNIDLEATNIAHRKVGNIEAPLLFIMNPSKENVSTTYRK